MLNSDDTTTTTPAITASSEAIALVCPACRGNLDSPDDNTLACAACGQSYAREDGVWNLVVGERFNDESDEECLCYEEVSNEYTARNYWVPLFRQFVNGHDRPLRVLGLGCGTGVEIDVLCEAGFDCVGIDCGNRSRIWKNRTYPKRLFLANGMHLPFEDGTFDIIFCGCVFPHVGVVGDSVTTSDTYLEDRSRLAAEMARALHPSGHVVVSSPNGNCPFDIFHGRKPGSYKPQWNPPTSKFLLTLRDYRHLFSRAGLTKAKLQRIENYWGFVRAKGNWKGRALSLPMRAIFWAASRESLRFLRGTPVVPWLVVHIRK